MRVAVLAMLAACGRIDFDVHGIVKVGYISSQGSDLGDGSRQYPWKTWSFALSHLGPGSTLIALDGLYDVASAGELSIQCRPSGNSCDGQPCANGLADAPIEVRAENERAATLTGDPERLVSVDTCSYWTVTGFHLVGSRLAPPPLSAAVLSVFKGDHVVVQRMVIEYSNPLSDKQPLVSLDSVADALFLENELYAFHYSAIDVSDTLRLVLRRNYINARGYTVPGSGCGNRPENGIAVTNATDPIVENNIVERACSAIAVTTNGLAPDPHPEWGDGAQLLGNTTIGSFAGVFIQSRCNFANPCNDPALLVENTIVHDAINITSDRAVWVRGAINTRIDHCSSFDAARNGFLADLSADNTGIASTTFITNSQASSAIDGFTTLTQATWQTDHVNAFAPTPFNPATFVTASTQIDPMLGTCRLKIPIASPLHGTGTSGTDMGATVEQRYEGGTLTTEPLWDLGGAFPCGATVDGVNDDPVGATAATEACGNVQLRLGSCP